MKRMDFYTKPQTWIGSIQAIMTLGFIVGFYYWLLLGFGLSIAGLVLIENTIIKGLIVVCAAIMLGLSRFPKRVQRWEWFLRLPVWQSLLDYFEFSIVFEDFDKVQKGNVIFAEFPHGVFPLGSLLSYFCVEKIMPGHIVYGLMASVIDRVPIVRHIFGWLGTKPATSATLASCLKDGSCGIVVGGIAEMFMLDPDRERIFVKQRLGFIRSAQNSGVNICPVYFLGQSQLLSVVGGSSDGFLARMSRKFQMSLIFFYGRWGLPIPQRSKIVMVIVSPIDVSGLSLEDASSLICSKLLILYESTRSSLPGWSSRPLSIE